MPEFAVGDVTYRTKHRLNARQQFHIARRLAPVISVIGAVVPMLQAAMAQQTITPETDDSEDSEEKAQIAAQRIANLEMLGRPIMEALGHLSDTDCDYVLDLCLSVVQRAQGNGSGPVWSDIWNDRSRRMMFEDIELPQMLQVAMEVLRENLMGFFSRAADDDGNAQSYSDESLSAITWVNLPRGEGYLMRPVLRGVYRMESLLDGTLDLEHVALANEALDVNDENERRYHRWAEQRRR